MSRSRHCNRRRALREIIFIVGHPLKTTTTMKWARQAQRQGKCQIVDMIAYWMGDVPLHTHRDPIRDDGTAIEYHHRQSGYAGPVVIQGERGKMK